MLLRAQYPNGLNWSIKDAMEIFDVGVRSQRIQQPDEPPRKRRCQLCPRKMDRRVKQQAMSAKNIAVINIQKNYAFAMIVLRKVLSKSNLLFSF